MGPRSALATKARKVRVLIVDDHPIVRQGLAHLINREPDLHVIGEAEHASQALRLVDAEQPDLVIVDIMLKDTSGLELIKQLKSRDAKTPILVISMHDESLYAERALRAGARGYVMKQEATASMLTAIRCVLRGQIYVSNQLEAVILQRLLERPMAVERSPIERLSDRELEIFELIGQGLSTREIAQRLYLSVKTVESHREHIKDKLHASTAAAVLRHAIHWVHRQSSTTPSIAA